MGLFSSKKKVSVSSSLYNLAGAIEDRPDFMKDTVISHVVSGNKTSLGDSIAGSLLTGPGIRFRSFARWARTSGYSTFLSWDPGQIAFGSNIDNDVIEGKIPHAPGQVVAIQTSEIDRADYGFWADQWMLENHPDEVTAEYEIDFNEQTNVITLEFTTPPKIYSFSPVGFDPLARYLYVSYMLIDKDIAGPWDEGAEIIVDGPEDWPDTTGWDLVETVNTPRTFDCVDTVDTVVSYSDGRPDETSSSSTPHTDPYTDVANAYEDAEYLGANPSGSGTSSLITRVTKTVFGGIASDTVVTSVDEDIGGGVIKTTTVTTVTEFVGDRYSYKEDTRTVINDQWSDMHVLIYKEGSGDFDYDQMFAPQQDVGTFVPFIPVRYFNDMVTESTYPEQTSWNERAVRKAMNKDYDFLTKQLEDNPSLGDIDFAYAVFGVPLNTPDNSAKKYIFKLFQLLNLQGGGGSSDYDAWKVQWEAVDAIQQNWAAWQAAQSNPADPLYGTPEPARAIYPAAPQRKMKAYGKKWNYHMELNWTSITEVIGSGLAKPGAKSGEVWFDSTSAEQFNEILISSGLSGDRTYESNTVFMYWQETADTYRAMSITGLWHNYMIYGGKGVDIHGADAMNDPDESGFLIPLHEGVFREISLKDATQMSTSCSYMLLNSYQVTKQKWYTKSWFKIVLIVAAIVVTVVTMGSGSGVGAGLASIAAATTTAAAVSAAVSLVVSLAVNAVVATLLMKMLTPIATSLFGDEFGAVIAAVGTVVLMAVAGSYASGGNAADAVTALNSAPELMKMSIAALNNYDRVQMTELKDIQKDMMKLQESYAEEMEVIQNAWKQNLGSGSGSIDPTVVSEAISMQYENSESFLSRTLLLGSDIVEMTNGFISAFVPLTISTELLT